MFLWHAGDVQVRVDAPKEDGFGMKCSSRNGGQMSCWLMQAGVDALKEDGLRAT